MKHIDIEKMLPSVLVPTDAKIRNFLVVSDLRPVNSKGHMETKSDRAADSYAPLFSHMQESGFFMMRF